MIVKQASAKRGMQRLCLLLSVVCMPVLSYALTEGFDAASWQHHEPLGSQVLTDDLIISVPSGSAIKGVRDPNALFPGYDPERSASMLVIMPRTAAYLSLNAFVATDLFQMSEPTLEVYGFRGDKAYRCQMVGPLWDSTNETGVIVPLTGFENMERIEIRSAGQDAVLSDVHFFLESLSYALSDEVLDDDALALKDGSCTEFEQPQQEISNPFGDGGSLPSGWWIAVFLFGLWRQHRLRT